MDTVYDCRVPRIVEMPPCGMTFKRDLQQGASPVPKAQLSGQRRRTPASLPACRDGPYRARLATASAIMRREAWALASRLVATSSSMGPEAGLAVQKGRSAARSSAKEPARQ